MFFDRAINRFVSLFRSPNRKPSVPIIEIDRLTIRGLQQAGSNLSLPHDVEFFFYFPTKTVALEVAELLKQDGYATLVERTVEGDKYSCQAAKSLILNVVEMSKLTVHLNALANRHGGEFDGWGAEVRP